MVNNKRHYVQDEYGYRIGTVCKFGKKYFLATVLDDSDKDRKVMFFTFHAAEQYIKDFVNARGRGLTVSEYIRTLNC
jgi:hypothetical protein